MKECDQARLEAAAQAERDGAHDLAEAEEAFIVYRLAYASIDPVEVPRCLTIERIFNRGADHNPRYIVQELERVDALPGETTGDISARADRLRREWETLVVTKLRPPRDTSLEVPE